MAEGPANVSAPLHASIHRLIAKAQVMVAEAKAHNKISPVGHQTKVCKVDEWEDTATGPAIKRAHVRTASITKWSPNVIHTLFLQLCATTEYQECNSLIIDKQPLIPDEPIQNASRRLVELLLQKPDLQVSALAKGLYLELAGEPVAGSATVSISGFRLEPKSVLFHMPNVVGSIRQVTLADYETPPPFSLTLNVDYPWPAGTALLQFARQAKTFYDFQRECEKWELLMRLAGVGGVKFGALHVESDAFLLPVRGATWPSSPVNSGPITFTLANAVADDFNAFIRELYPLLPQNLWDLEDKSENYLKIAYERYCDALFHTKRIEGGIAFAVMALEALYLGTEEQLELKYRLSLRTSKFISWAGADAMTTHELIKRAYDIRSTYVHGGHLTAKETSRFERKLNISLVELRRYVLEVVRITIVYMILSKENKTTFLEGIDASLLSPERDTQLREQAGGMKKLLLKCL